MIRAPVPELELVRLSAHRQGENLVPQADPQDGHLPEQLRRLPVVAHHRGRVAGPVREHYAMGLLRQDLARGHARGNHSHPAAGID